MSTLFFRSSRLPRLLVMSVALLSACSKPVPSEEPVRAVKLLTVGVSSLQTEDEFAGEVRPRVESRLGFRVAGKLMRRHVELGQRVQAGQLLAQLDAQDFLLAADAVQAQLGAATTNRDLAAADYKRFKELKEQNFISGAELERRDATLKAAQAQVDQARAQLAAQRNQGTYASLVADVAGVVTAVEAEPGQVVSSGTPVVRIAQDGPRDAVFAVPEDKVAGIRAGAPVDVRVWSGSARLAGKVREVSASADSVTRTYQVKVALEGPPPPLGATVSVLLAAPSPRDSQQIKLPTSALRQDGKATAVWVLEPASMTVRSQAIELAALDGNEAVVAGGLQPGMRVVAAGVHVLSPGQKVTIYQDKSAPVPQAQAVSSAAASPATPASK